MKDEYIKKQDLDDFLVTVPNINESLVLVIHPSYKKYLFPFIKDNCYKRFTLKFEKELPAKQFFVTTKDNYEMSYRAYQLEKKKNTDRP